MRDFLISLDRKGPKSLQAQLREVLVAAILAGHLRAGEKLPSTRHLSGQLGIARNTVVLVYQGLTGDGYLRTSERSGYFVNETVHEMDDHRVSQSSESKDTQYHASQDNRVEPVKWAERFKQHPSSQENITKPDNWRDLPFPFIYGQPDPSLFPITDWRDCVYKAMGKKWIDDWSQDTIDHDDPMLVEQIRTRILPRRGILAGEDQILVTMGAQQALYLIASLLVDVNTRIAFEEPGYVDARNIFALRSELITLLPVDHGGLPVDRRLDDTDLVYTTPSHQMPTSVTMPTERRRALLKAASKQDFLIVEDDYELESNYVQRPIPALKSFDKEGRVIYVGSFSKMLFPGLRLGFVVASKELIQEIRAMRRLMVRHPPFNNQRSTAFFLSLGYYDVYIRRMHRVYRERWTRMGEALATYFPQADVVQGMGGTAYWVNMPKGFDSDQFAQRALEAGIFIEPGSVYCADKSPNSAFRLGFSLIPAENIGPGIKQLADIAGGCGN